MSKHDFDEAVKFLSKAKSRLENEISLAAHQAVEKFERDTGLTPSYINIQMMEVTAMNDANRRFCVAGASADVEVFR